MYRLIFCLLALLPVSACQISPSHPSLDGAGLSKLLPVRQFVANTSFNDNYQLSPDGQKMVYQGVVGLRSAIIIEDLNKTVADRVLRFKQNAPYPFWAADGRHVLFHKDGDGRENYHVFAVNTNDPNLTQRDLTPFENTKAFVVRVPQRQSDTVYIMHNARDPAVFDLYEVNVATGQQKLLFENEGGIESLLIDDNGVVKARVVVKDKKRSLEIAKAKGAWEPVLESGLFDTAYPLEVNSQDNVLYAISNINTDKLQFISIDLSTGAQTVLFADENFDVNNVHLSSRDGRPLYASMHGEYPSKHFFDQRIGEALTSFSQEGQYAANIMSMTRVEDAMTVAKYNETGAGFYYYNLDTGEQRLLGQGASSAYADHLAAMQPITVSASDGLTLRGYLSLPNGVEKKNLPTVLLVHGGPWVRDTWGYDTATQFLTNRGYAVLRINYRGSSGFGKQFMFSAEKQFAGQMHQDLIDSIDWAIEQGISDPDRIAIMGRSYGGYATLVGMTMTPDRFACGIDIVGVSDLVSLLEDVPPYWRNSMHMWHRMVGDPSIAEDREDMAKRSPINFADKVKNPLLIMHGVNDPRVGVDQSERMVAELKKHGKQVNYIPIKGEGHSFNHWKNELKIYRETEDFLAACLGGRSSGFDFYSLGSWAF